MTDNDSTQPLDGKSVAERVALGCAVLDADRRHLYSLSLDERKAVSQFIALIAARLFEVGTLIVAGYNDAADEIAEQLEALDKLPPAQPEDNDAPF
jgi:hypothetical protein